jgi:hypothetical protein
MKCPTCHGTKHITTTVTFHGRPDVETMQLDCVVCDGTGKVTRAMAKALAAHNADWCRCKAPDPNAVQYYPDGAHPVRASITTPRTRVRRHPTNRVTHDTV